MEPFFEKMIAMQERAAGIYVPLFSLRTENDWGVGEFLDLKLLIDWAVQSGISLIQLLPVNDTSVTFTWKDSYPYSSLSTFALHPIYLSIRALGGEHIGEQPDSPSLDYEDVLSKKMHWLETHFSHVEKAFFEGQEFERFTYENKYWLQPYALFCALRDHYKTSDFQKWDSFKDIDEEKLALYTAPDSPFFSRVQFYQYIQFHLDKQFTEVVSYAKNQGVLLKGDFAVGVHRHSVDVWFYRRFFNLDKSIGAPPDFFNALGQNWGFPSYHWNLLEQTGYEWFCQRLKYLSRYFQLIRIDHILGYFRLWEIPFHAINGLMGHFNPCLPILKHELNQRGIVDIERLTRPFIDDFFLTEIAKTSRDQILHFIDLYKTEKEVARHVSNKHQQEALFQYLGNRILFKDEHISDAYHFRFDMDKTYSFKCLDSKTQNVLKELYEDYFLHRQDGIWKQEALKKLPFFQKASQMLVCAEDLGFVPKCVKEVLSELNILELYIQRMPKTPQEFALPWEYPYLSVCSPSNHDTSVLRQWWQEDLEQTKRYCRTVLKIKDFEKSCTPEMAELVLQQHLDSKSMWTIFLLQDVLALKPFYCEQDPKKERINDPKDPDHYWNFRFPFDFEILMKDSELNSQIKNMIIKSGRLINLKNYL